MTAEGRFLIRTWRDRTRRRYLHEHGVDIPLAEHLPPIHERGKDFCGVSDFGGKRKRRQSAERMEALAA